MDQQHLEIHAAHDEEVVSSRSLESIRNFISSLPTEDGWRDVQPYCSYQGFWCYPGFLEGIMLAQQHFEPKPRDVVLCSYPKCGTTWLKALSSSIVFRTSLDDPSSPLLHCQSHDLVPDFTKLDFRRPGVPLVDATHVPFASLPKSILNSGSKIIYICRDPKDAFVSMFFFVAKLRPKEYEPISLEQAFELFCQGKSMFGPFCSHVLGFWQASLERPEQVLFLKYEDVIKDTAFYVKKMAEFMGYPISLEEEQQGAVQKIVEHCSFEHLSNLEVNKTGALRRSAIKSTFENNIFFRKGKVGDWKNHLTLQMAERLDKIVEEQLQGSGLKFDVSW